MTCLDIFSPQVQGKDVFLKPNIQPWVNQYSTICEVEIITPSIGYKTHKIHLDDPR